MRLTTFIKLNAACMLSGTILIGCVSYGPAFDSNPPRAVPAAKLAARAAASEIECNKNHADPLVRIPPKIPSRALRTGRVEFIFDLDDSGTPTNVRIKNATEDIFIRPTLGSLEKWQYTGKFAGEPVSQRQNICAALTFNLRDKRGRKIPMWTDIAAKNDAYKKYKRFN